MKSEVSLLLPTEYAWLETLLADDSLWLSDSLNWELAFTIFFNDFTLYDVLATPFFSSSFFFLDSHTKFSFLDVMFALTSSNLNISKEFYYAYAWDAANNFSKKYLPAQFFFYVDYQNYMTILLYRSPELIAALDDFLNLYWVKAVLRNTPSVVFDLFGDASNRLLAELTDYFFVVLAFMWILAFISAICDLLKVDNPVEAYLLRITHYFYSLSRETRIQTEAALQTFFFFLLYWSMMIFSFDDDKEEFIEIFDTGTFFFFLALICFLLFKYSQHYFAFLEASVSEGRSVSYVSKQFFRDFVNTFALFLRFFILLFRLNVYDTLDDFYDSYYIYVGDFDDDEYLNEAFVSFYSVLFFDSDNNDDRAFSLEDENDFVLDFFYAYFLCWAKFFTFIFFILEEVLRLSLAFYICYLIIFEVHSVNCSYTEDNYFTRLRVEDSRKNFSERKFFKFY